MMDLIDKLIPAFGVILLFGAVVLLLTIVFPRWSAGILIWFARSWDGFIQILQKYVDESESGGIQIDPTEPIMCHLIPNDGRRHRNRLIYQTKGGGLRVVKLTNEYFFFLLLLVHERLEGPKTRWLARQDSPDPMGLDKLKEFTGTSLIYDWHENTQSKGKLASEFKKIVPDLIHTEQSAHSPTYYTLNSAIIGEILFISK